MNTYMNTSFHQEGTFWAYKTRLSPPLLFIEVSVPSQESQRLCICVLAVSMLSLFLRYFYYIVELFQECDYFSILSVKMAK
jgi:hypothetical protein